MAYRVTTVNEHGEWHPSAFVFKTWDEAWNFGRSIHRHRDSFEVEQCDEHPQYLYVKGSLYAHGELDWA